MTQCYNYRPFIPLANAIVFPSITYPLSKQTHQAFMLKVIKYVIK